MISGPTGLLLLSQMLTSESLLDDTDTIGDKGDRSGANRAAPVGDSSRSAKRHSGRTVEDTFAVDRRRHRRRRGNLATHRDRHHVHTHMHNLGNKRQLIVNSLDVKVKTEVRFIYIAKQLLPQQHCHHTKPV